MFNVTGGEVALILLLGLIILGPEKLPDAMRRVGKTWGELRKMTSTFQDEVRKGFEEPVGELKKTSAAMKEAGSFAKKPVNTLTKDLKRAATGGTPTKPVSAAKTLAQKSLGIPAAAGLTTAKTPEAAAPSTAASAEAAAATVDVDAAVAPALPALDVEVVLVTGDEVARR